MKNYQLSFIALFLGTLLLVLGCSREEFSGYTVPTEPDSDVPAELRGLDFYKSSSGVTYLRPTGRDDTDMIRDALNNAQPDEMIVLHAGVFRIRPIFITDFKGHLVGCGIDKTIIQPFGNMKFPEQNFGEYASEENPYPFLMTFRGGNIHLSQMTIKMPQRIRATWTINGNQINALGGLVLITGERVTSYARQVKFEGAVGNYPAPGWNNVINGYWVLAPFNSPDGASGRHFVQSCIFDNLFVGTVLGPVSHVDLTVGGSPKDANTYTNLVIGVELRDISASRMEVSHNTFINPRWDAVFWEHGTYVVPKQRAQLLFSDNYIEANLTGDAGFIRDLAKLRGEESTMKLSYYNNEIKMEGPQRLGLRLIGLNHANIVQNTLSGKSYAGIFLNAGSYCRVIKNQMKDLDASFASVWLGPGTSENYVAAYENDIVVDQGKDNTIVGTQNQKIKALRNQEEVAKRSTNMYGKTLIGKNIKPW